MHSPETLTGTSLNTIETNQLESHFDLTQNTATLYVILWLFSCQID